MFIYSDFKPYTAVGNDTFYEITPATLTICLAYVNHYTPKLLPRKRLLAPAHLRELAERIGQPMPTMLSLREHLSLAAHFAVLYAASLFQISHSYSFVDPGIKTWLNLSTVAQLDILINAIMTPERWEGSLNELGLNEIIKIDYLTYICQQFQRQQQQPVEPSRPAVWLPQSDDENWFIRLPPTLPSLLLFDLLQLGEWYPDEPLHCTPLSIASPPACHYGYEHIRYLLESAALMLLTAAQDVQLRAWLQRANAYRLNGSLLSTAQPEQMQVIRQQRRLNQYIVEQIGPRHALINRAVIPMLRRWLARQGFPLAGEPVSGKPARLTDAGSAGESVQQAHWLGLRLLVGLQQFMPLPCPAPTEQLHLLSQQLSPETVAEWEMLARHSLQGINELIAGRDAFFPSAVPPQQSLIDLIKDAIYTQQTIMICYQAPGQPVPRQHTVEPFRLEQRSSLYYLHAYSYLAEAERTFRLDRVVDFT